jgi:geranylgeranyl diphosphate synthase, type II
MVSGTALVRRTLADDYRFVRAGVVAAVPNEEPKRYLYDLIASYQARAGKGFRASLCLASCRAFGGTSDMAREAAVALELLHSAFLIHDDIEDDSHVRRGQPALHRSHGVALALNAGDGLCALALSQLARCATLQASEVGVALMGEVAHLFRRTVEGQAWELGWIADRSFDVTETDYLRMVLGKTCWYSTIHPCRMGAIIGSKGKASLDIITRFGVYLGAAFQIRDDVDNLLAAGDPTYGKDACSDIIEGKRTLPLLRLLSQCSKAERTEVIRLIAGKGAECPAERIARVRSMMTAVGSIDYARDVADRFARLALDELPSAFAGADQLEVEYLAALVRYLCGIEALDAA